MAEHFVENYENMTDAQLVRLFNAGKYEILGILISRYIPVIRYYAKHYASFGLDEEDLVQEGLVALYTAVKDFEETKASFSTFVSLCVCRGIRSAVKAKTRRRIIPSEMLSPLDDVEIADVNSPEKIFFDKENYQLLTDSIKVKLSALEYRVLQLFLSGIGYVAIADKLKISVKSVDNSLKRIRKKLKNK